MRTTFRNRRIARKDKARLFNTCVLPTLIYASECWTTIQSDRRRLAVAQRRMERTSLGITIQDRKTTRWIHDRSEFRDAVTEATKRKWKWAEQIVKAGDNRWTRRLLEWQPRGTGGDAGRRRQWKRRTGRPKTRWRDVFRKQVGATWMPDAREGTNRWNEAKRGHFEEISEELLP